MNTSNFSSVKFHKSSFCNYPAGCVEVGIKDGFFAIRDSKNPNNGLLVFNKEEWVAFIKGVKRGEFDPS
ncbi:MAG: DUF397 domain-containing protein [Xenococcus sp. MO_188.B8]|nr:DUF397 domain-containing protein [Xenococcus sp. MO_188.B8]